MFGAGLLPGGKDGSPISCITVSTTVAADSKGLDLALALASDTIRTATSLPATTGWLWLSGPAVNGSPFCLTVADNSAWHYGHCLASLHCSLKYAESIILTLINYKFLHVKVTYEWH